MRRRRASRADADTLRTPFEHVCVLRVSYSTSETRMLSVFVLRGGMLGIGQKPLIGVNGKGCSSRHQYNKVIVQVIFKRAQEILA
jgi:hypothetical protein